MMDARLAVYTTVYSGVEKYLADWYRSILAQTDRDFDLWIGIDGLDIEQVVGAIGVDPRPTWLMFVDGESSAQIRFKAIERMVGQYSLIVFVDSDDLLGPSRVAAARKDLEKYDVVACALRIINEDGQDLGLVFGPGSAENIHDILPYLNVFGLSNTAYRTETLRSCLPIPRECALVDWLLITRAWSLGAHLHFDFTPRMAYRQYPENLATVIPPFAPSQVLRATERVLNHYKCVLSPGWEVQDPYRGVLVAAYYRVEEFYRSISGSNTTLDNYVTALNRMPPRYVWWWFVAHPDLENIWLN